ncbi:MAG: proline dehydrogenase family protein [Flavobacteriales bacterium]
MSKRFDNTEVAFKVKTDYELKKAYYLFSMIASETLTNVGSFMLNKTIGIGLIKNMVKQTVFKHFCAGENKQESLKLIKTLNDYNVKSILDYSVEGKDNESDFDRTFQEVLENIDLTKKTEGIPFVVFKPTGFGSLNLYEKIQNKETLSDKDQAAWERVKSRYYEVCKKAHQLHVRIMVDAEDSWGQTAIDDLVEDLMREFNKEYCIVSNTLQMYRHDRLDYLQEIYERAQKENYILGFKVVRGAYMEKERERAKEKGYPSPINSTKEATDQLYDAALEFILNRIDRILLFAGTHNEKSSEIVLSTIENKGLSTNHDHIWLGQLYGMSDNISFNAAKEGFNVTKYLPYGPVQDVMPYLIRRAEENTSIAGQTTRELDLIKQEIKRRKR